MRVVFLNDVHCLYRHLTVPDGDVVIVAGDLTIGGTVDQLREVADFLRSLPHPYKIVVGGNHDSCLELDPAGARQVLQGLTYLEDSGVVFDGVRFWGSPWTHPFRMPNHWAFGAELSERQKRWSRIPEGTDVVITHAPPLGILDRTVSGVAAGCPALRDRIHEISPKVHHFGHIHEARGIVTEKGTTFVNAAIKLIGSQNPCQPLFLDVS